ncbi:hypothetical protein ACOT81_38060 [Streptomyces sp. WI04-05B]|uniref:hypothetical protein n=1 Tax=Streptomyces TaxID=1883 RepID=UPI0029B4E396|nr:MULTISPECIES: hypothetical protein [unclassified Streptomyces]MDX2545871.1 hypothetical protein [Streptomyces sp. WI04-05B]MDX2586430.1 hypothetical protein [Streptomyces sp. WI04-05A]
MIVFPVRLLSIPTLFLLIQSGWLGDVFKEIYIIPRKVSEKWPGALSGAAKLHPLEWYNMTTVTLVLCMVPVLLFYAIKPLLLLNLLLGRWAKEAELHRGSLFVLERRLRAALILYGHAAKCLRALEARGWVRDSLTNSSRILSGAEREIFQSWKRSRPAGRLWLPRHQRIELKIHSGQVVALLRARAASIDADRANGLRELGCLLVKIGDRLAEGRVGALVEEGELEGFRPVHDREALKTLAVAVLVTASAIGIAVLRLPAEVATPLTTLMGISVLAVVYRKAGGAEAVSLLLGGK